MSEEKELPGTVSGEFRAPRPHDSGETVSPDPSWPAERKLRWYQVASHILLLNCSEVTRRKAAAAADREAVQLPDDAPAKVIIVTEHGGRERRYAASSWDVTGDENGLSLDVGTRDAGAPLPLGASSLNVAVTYAPGHWVSVREDGVEVLRPTSAEVALEVAKKALSDIAEGSPISAGLPAAMQAIAREALEDIYAETE